MSSIRLGNWTIRLIALGGLAAIAGTSPAAALSACEWNGIPLHGKVEVVTSFPDIKVQEVSSFGDLKVQYVSGFADDCGEWEIVSSFGDFKIQYVDSFPDIKIEVVSSFPGLP